VSAVALGKIEIPPCLAMEDAPAANSESLGAIAPLARVLVAKTSATAMLPPGICCWPYGDVLIGPSTMLRIKREFEWGRDR
jgi:hypothetical protein